MRTAIEYLDRPPTGWFLLDVVREEARKWDWIALMIEPGSFGSE
jgi:hypothetical protein